jgi:hypothetical protein
MRRVRELFNKRQQFYVVRSDDLINRILSITQYLGLAFMGYWNHNHLEIFTVFDTL